MGPYDKELMMAILTASTALAGLTGVVIGQIRQSKLTARSRFCFSGLLVITFVFAGIAIARAINWLGSPEDWESQEARCYFEIQLVLFLVVATAFWLSDLTMRIRLTNILTVLKKVRKSIVSAIFIAFSWLLQQFTRVRETIQAACKEACEKVKRVLNVAYSWISWQIVRIKTISKALLKKPPSKDTDEKKAGQTSMFLRLILLFLPLILGGIRLMGCNNSHVGNTLALFGACLLIIGIVIPSQFFARIIPNQNERDSIWLFVMGLGSTFGVGGLALSGVEHHLAGMIFIYAGLLGLVSVFCCFFAAPFKSFISRLKKTR
jgi:hypothetical protein